HTNLGLVLHLKGRLDEAFACHKRAIKLDPKLAKARVNLGRALKAKGRYDEAIASYRKAVDLDPKDADARDNLGTALGLKGRLDEAIASFKKAIELAPKRADTHISLGYVLKSRGRFGESLAAFRRGHELGSRQRGWRFPSAAWVREAERLAALEAKLPAFLKGQFKPKDTQERPGLASVCQAKRLFAAAARLYADAFTAEPKVADDLKDQHRYNPACCGALAAAGKGKDAVN